MSNDSDPVRTAPRSAAPPQDLSPEEELRRVEVLLGREPDDARLQVRKAQLQLALRQRRAAIESANRVASLPGAGAWELRLAAAVLGQCNATAAARACLERARGISPGHAVVLYDLALSYFFANDEDEAERCLDVVLRQFPQHGGALYLRSVLRTQTASRNHVEDLRARLASGRGTPADAAATHYALAKEYEDLGDHARAFAALQTGAKLKRRLLNYSSSDEIGALRAIESAFGPDAAAAARPGCDREAPIFVLGIPRTGTTLVERMLSSHPDVESIGEFPDFPVLLREQADRVIDESPGTALTPAQASVRVDFAELGNRYLDSARQLCTGPRFVDKLPYNSLYCGHLVKALPRARLIHVVRNPLDTCYAVYKTLFDRTYSYSYDFDELADYFVAYRRLMDHWHRVVPGTILDVAYEDLVNDPEREARRILDWCNLDWNPAVLDFHRQSRDSTTASAAQVRRPIYDSSVGKWRRYASELAPLRERLAAAGVPTGDTPAT
ncbi:MAG: sulfotransferase [Steroidobacteraceae bacterium]